MQMLKHAVLKLFVKNNRFIGEHIKHKHLHLVKQIENATKFLPNNAKLAERCYCIVHNISTIQLCEQCGKQYKRFISFRKGYKPTCSEKCARILANKRINNLQKSNAHKRSQQKLANLPCNKNAKYKAWTQLPCVKLKMLITTFENTGQYTMPWATKQAREKAKQTEILRYGRRSIDIISTKEFWMQKYGIDNPAKLESVKRKMSQNNAMHNEEYKQKSILSKRKRIYKQLQTDSKVQLLSTFDEYLKGGILKWQCLTCGTIYEKTLNYRYLCPFCYPDKTSQLVNKLINFLRDINVSFELHNRSVINPYEIDIYLSDYKLGIEVHGLYWHSELTNIFDKYAHKNKADLCAKKGIVLLQFFEDEILYKFPIVCSIIKHKLMLTQHKIYARNCTIEPVHIHIAKQFLNDNHLAGYAIGKHIGLFHNNELVQLVTYAKPRFSNHDIELIRIATKRNTLVIGGLSKLIKHVIEQSNAKTIISYVDRRVGTPTALQNIGFSLTRVTEPGYFWVDVKNRQRYPRQYMQKYKLKQLFGNIGESLSEREILEAQGWTRIWDAGHYVMEWKKK